MSVGEQSSDVAQVAYVEPYCHCPCVKEIFSQTVVAVLSVSDVIHGVISSVRHILFCRISRCY